MNIGSNVIVLNVGNVLNKKQLDKENLDKQLESGLKISEVIEDTAEINGKVENLSLMSDENLIASESSIKDIVMAEELLKNTKNSILQQSAVSMLAQANQQPHQIIGLLG